MAKQETKNKKAVTKKTEDIKLDHLKWYKFESNGTFKTMQQKGEIFPHVGGAVAESLVNNGFGKIV